MQFPSRPQVQLLTTPNYTHALFFQIERFELFNLFFFHPLKKLFNAPLELLSEIAEYLHCPVHTQKDAEIIA